MYVVASTCSRNHFNNNNNNNNNNADGNVVQKEAEKKLKYKSLL